MSAWGHQRPMSSKPRDRACPLRPESGRIVDHPATSACANSGREQVQQDAPEKGPQSYSMTSSALASNVGGTVRPSIRAVWGLMLSAKLDACTTGKSAGLAPLRMWPVYMPTWRHESTMLLP